MDKKTTLHEWNPIKAGAEVYVIKGDRVLMFRRSDDSPMFPGYWVGPGGHVDDNEDFLTAALREVKEETGVIANTKEIKLKVIAIHRRKHRNEVWILPIFVVKVDENTELVTNEEGRAEWIEINKLQEMEKVLPSAKYYFDHVLNDKPGIMYTNLIWDEKGLVEESSRSIDRDY